MKYQHEAIFCIVNSGYSDVVMEAAKKLGARGGTVINARGTAPKDAESFFGITIQPEKEIVIPEKRCGGKKSGSSLHVGIVGHSSCTINLRNRHLLYLRVRKTSHFLCLFQF